MSEIEVKNAIIASARLTADDHGLLSGWLNLDYGGSGQGFGGYALYLPKSFSHHKLESVAGHFIWRCMEVAGVEHWNDLPGKSIRVKCEWSKIHAIGHIVKDDWFDPSQDFKVLEQKANQSACLQATLDENRLLKDEACRYYLADGTFKVFEPEVALEMRKGAALEMKALQDRLSQAIDTCHTLDLRVQELVNEKVNLRRKLDGTPDGVWVLESEHNRVMGKLAAFNLIEGENRGLRARLAAIDAAKAGEPPMPAVDGDPWDVDIKGLAAWGRKGWDVAAALRVQLASMKCMDEEAIADLQVIGARKERERIIALLVQGVSLWDLGREWVEQSKPIVHLSQEMSHFAFAEEFLRAVLEPEKEVADEAAPF